jgi:hypothetical protein
LATLHYFTTTYVLTLLGSREANHKKLAAMMNVYEWLVEGLHPRLEASNTAAAMAAKPAPIQRRLRLA